jgi:polyphosphate:AMP phosphotransferase
MLERVDLSEKLPRAQYQELMPALDIRLSVLQRRAIDQGLPVIVVFEGWEAAGKATLINRMIRQLDRRHFKVHSIEEPTEEERLHPYFWRFWRALPPKGSMSVFDRSWYRRVLQDAADGKVDAKERRMTYERINRFEALLRSEGCLIIKLFLHISKKEQKNRFEKLEARKATSWRITRQDWAHHKHYKKYEAAAEGVFKHTSSADTPWHVIAAEDRRSATVRIAETVCGALEEAVEGSGSSRVEVGGGAGTAAHGRAVSDALGGVDLTRSVTRDEYERRLDRYQKRLRELEHEIYRKRVPVVIAYEGWDAAGKGGNIKRLTQSLDPRGYEVVPIGAPNEVEKRFHYLWRFWREMPKAGHITVFDRSWYGRVLVERVERMCAEDQWHRAYEEINDMEAQLVESGAVLVKFWLEIDKAEQLRRFRERERIPYKRWKITEDDWRNRRKWNKYRDAVADMLAHTDTRHAPWTVVESNSKHYARLKAMTTVIDAVTAKL